MDIGWFIVPHMRLNVYKIISVSLNYLHFANIFIDIGINLHMVFDMVKCVILYYISCIYITFTLYSIHYTCIGYMYTYRL